MSESKDAILAALLDVIASEGIEKASVRAVASRAGVSIGAVQHHFRTKEQMLEAAMAEVSAQIAGAFAPEQTAGLSASDLLRTFALTIGCADEELGAYAGVWLDFASASRVRPGLEAIHAQAAADMRAALTRLILAVRGEDADAAAAEADAVLLSLTLDGIATARAAEPGMTTARAEGLVDAALARIVG